jgi:hypothetical protein
VLALVAVLLAGLLVAPPVAAQAGTRQLSGTAYFSPSPGAAPCAAAEPPYDDYPALVLSGSLEGCWYTDVRTARTTPGGVYLESGVELFVGRLDGGAVGTFTTTYTFEAKLDPSGAEVRGRCQHPILAGSGDGGFAGATGRVDFKDIVDGSTITYVYRGQIALR